MKSGKINTSAAKQSNSFQSKAKNQASEHSIIQAFKEETLQGKFNGNVAQRHAFWAVNGQSKVDDPVPVAAAPGGRHIKREGGDTNQRLYNKVTEAQNAAKKNTAWSGEGFSSRKPSTPQAGAGVYHYNETVSQNGGADVYNVTAGTAMVVKHDQDNQAALTESNGTAHTGVKHFHAATSNNSNIHPPASQSEQPGYNPAGDIAHYFVNPIAR